VTSYIKKQTFLRWIRLIKMMGNSDLPGIA
jgi:hypothetical protein